MIKISKLSDYAIVVLNALASGEGQLQTASILARQTGIPEPTVSKVLKLLAKKDIIRSTRGVKGGYVLARAVAEISVADLIEALDGPIAITSCMEPSDSSCHIVHQCPLRDGWGHVNRTLRASLQAIPLTSLLAPLRCCGDKKEGGCS